MDDFAAFADLLASAAKSGSWSYLLAAFLMFVVWGVRKWSPQLAAFTPWAWADRLAELSRTDAGGVATTGLMAFFGALCTSLSPGTALTWAMVAAAGKISLAAMGGYGALKKLLIPLAVKLGSWLLGKFGIKTSAQKIAEAERAGDAAVAAKPGGGISSVVGKPRDVQ